MKRRSFLASCAAAATGVSLFRQQSALAAPPSEKPYSKVKLNMSVPLDWFPGSNGPEKLDGVAEWGFPAYEWLNPSGDLDALRAKADSLGVELSCIVGAGAIKPGGMVNPDDHDMIVDQFKERIAMAKKLNCKRLVGLTGNERTDVSRDEQTAAVIKCLKRLAPMAEENDVILVMEALNPLVDHKGFFLNRTDHTVQILKEINSPNVKMLFDIYHQQITEGNVIRNLTENIEWIGHFHVADNPGRKEPGTGELNYVNIFKAIEKTEYKGLVALECGHSNKNYEDTLKATLACLNA